MDTESLSFGDWLRSELDRRGISPAELARRVGTERGTVSNWLKGKRRPSAESCERIAKALNLAPNLVLRRAGRLSELPQPIDIYEFERELRELRQLEAEREVRLRRLEELRGPSVLVRDRGRLPANSVRWVSEEVRMEAVPSWMLRGRSPERVFVARASGDCLQSRMIADGDLVFLEQLPDGQQPRNGDIVAVRFHDEVTLKVWYRDGDWIELRDADGKLVHRFSIFDDFAVEGVVFARFG